MFIIFVNVVRSILFIIGTIYVSMNCNKLDICLTLILRLVLVYYYCIFKHKLWSNSLLYSLCNTRPYTFKYVGYFLLFCSFFIISLGILPVKFSMFDHQQCWFEVCWLVFETPSLPYCQLFLFRRFENDIGVYMRT